MLFQKSPETAFYAEIYKALSGFTYEKNVLIKGLEYTGRSNIIWGNGIVCVLCLDTLLLLNQEQIPLVMSQITNLYYDLKHKTEYQGILSPHIFLLEDFTSIVFKNYLGSGIVVAYNDLSDLEKLVFDTISKELKIHTYSLLFAGICPVGFSVESTHYLGDPYHLT